MSCKTSAYASRYSPPSPPKSNCVFGIKISIDLIRKEIFLNIQLVYVATFQLNEMRTDRPTSNYIFGIKISILLIDPMGIDFCKHCNCVFGIKNSMLFIDAIKKRYL